MERKMNAKRITQGHHLKTIGDETMVEGVEIVARPAIPRSPPHRFWPDFSIRLGGRDNKAYLAGEFASCR